MPIYEYKCAECGSMSEYLVRLEEDVDIECRICGSTDLVRVLSAGWFMSKYSYRSPGRTCCGREERCETPPCAEDGTCRKR
jgi:putative FmdB family regulatory protein